MDQERPSTSQRDRSGRIVRRRLIPPPPIHARQRPTTVQERRGSQPRGSRTLPRSTAPRRRGHHINNTQRPLRYSPVILTAATSRQNLVDTTAYHSRNQNPEILTGRHPDMFLDIDHMISGHPHSLQQLTASTSIRGHERRRSLRSAQHYRVSSVSSEVPQSTAVHLRSGISPRGSRTLPRSMAPHLGGYHGNTTQPPLRYSPNQEFTSSSDMDQELASMSQGNRSGRTVRRRLIPPPPIQSRQRHTTLQEPRGSQPRIQPVVSNENTQHHGPSSTLDESISGFSELSHGLQPLNGSTFARQHEHLWSIQLSLHYRVSYVSFEVQQSTAVHLRTLPRLMDTTQPTFGLQYDTPVILTAPTSRQNLVDSAADHSRNQNAEILTGRDHMSDDYDYEELLELEGMTGDVGVGRGIKTSELHQFVKKIICCGEQDNDEICVICQEQYVKGDVMGQLKCSHLYHMPCISDWMQEKAICPICRAQAARFE